MTTSKPVLLLLYAILHCPTEWSLSVEYTTRMDVPLSAQNEDGEVAAAMEGARA